MNNAKHPLNDGAEAVNPPLSRYVPFLPFDRWQLATIDERRWDYYTTQLQEQIERSPDRLTTAREYIKRAAAIETGAIEGLYAVDRGFTITAAYGVAVWEAALNQRETQTRHLIESQLAAYDYVLDFATRQQPIAESWIRELHRVMCQAQTTYVVHTPAGPQHRDLQVGVYKHETNIVLQADGSTHEYAPFDLVPQEMHRLCEELRSEHFTAAHPVLQAAYAHHALVAIHPFADGNGRVARALASVFTYRALSIPILITDDTKTRYFNTLEAADTQQIQPFVDFIFQRVLDSIRLVEESLRAAAVPEASDMVARLRSRYITTGGYTHETVDFAGYAFFKTFEKQVREQLTELTTDTPVTFALQPNRMSNPVLLRPTSRWPVVDGRRELIIKVNSAPPAQAEVSWIYLLEVPNDCNTEDTLVLHRYNGDDAIEARITDLHPQVSTALEMRLFIAVRRIIGELLNELDQKALTALRRSGYGL
jgi:Fic family protein